MPTFESIQRPERWAVPFSPEMTDADVDRLLTIEPFASLDPTRFRGKVTLRGILKNDTRLVRCQAGDIVVRQGDWGNSAFLVISGNVRVELGSAASLPSEILGRQSVPRKSLFQSIAQLWKKSSEPEVRDVAAYRDDPRIGTRGTGEQTRIYLQDVSTVLSKYKTATIEAGQFFGESAALGRTPRQATVFAERSTQLLEIRWQGLRDLMRRDDGLQKHIDTVFRDRALKWFLLNTPIFSHLGSEDINELVAQATFETHGQYDWAGSFKRLAKEGIDTDLQHEPLIAEEGNHPNGVVIVRSGLARLSRRHEHGHRTTGYLTPGQIYGLDEIIDGWLGKTPKPLTSSLRAIGIANVVTIPTRLIEKLLLEKADRRNLLGRGSSPTDPLANRPKIDTTRINSDFVEFLVENRYVNGTATMLIDMDRCTRCDDCVRACADTHDNNPRFLRRGPIQNNIMVAHACMHCEDPVCMIECPTGAIHRQTEGGQVVINDQTCIGCSACANNCLYNAIRMVEVRHQDGDFIRDDQKHAPIVKATKCDLCSDQLGGPACQRACPHDALIRMDMRDVKQLTDWYTR
ncbi:MAG: cyclic nucleotide-binding domain-containing protein [Planctomycetaceae bacterium]|nr:cyclic nucleotide-binding domain-containing protein [Planctomycetales bacterium]MCB9940846.1 cyclic nucleotide-binding domain-containing protein [Planctomycetaceae bacterium]